MANISKYYLSEQCKRLLNGGDPSVASRVHIEEIKAALNNVINVKLKAEHFSVTLPGGHTIPDGATLCTYDNIAVISWKGVSKSTLPVQPISLLRNMGVFHISKIDCPNDPFIPIQAGQFAFIKEQPLISAILGQTGYEVNGNEVIYTKDLTASSPMIDEVMMKLVVMDVSSYTDFETLPVPADMAWDIIKEVYQVFSSEPMPDKIVDSNQNQLT